MWKQKRGMLEVQSFLGGNDQRHGKVGSDRYEGLGIFSDEGCSLDLTEDLEA
jgi:hypothetical protein